MRLHLSCGSVAGTFGMDLGVRALPDNIDGHDGVGMEEESVRPSFVQDDSQAGILLVLRGSLWTGWESSRLGDGELNMDIWTHQKTLGLLFGAAHTYSIPTLPCTGGGHLQEIQQENPENRERWAVSTREGSCASG